MFPKLGVSGISYDQALNEHFKISEEVLRHMVLRVDAFAFDKAEKAPAPVEA